MGSVFLVSLIPMAMCLSAEHSSQKVTFFTSKAFRVALISVLSWGLGFFLVGRIDRINWSDQNLVIAIVPLFISAYIVERTGGDVKQILAMMFQKNNLAMWLPGITASIGLLGFFAAASLGDSAIIPAVVASASPVVTTVLAATFSKEKLLRINIIGIIVVVAGVMLLNAG